MKKLLLLSLMLVTLSTFAQQGVWTAQATGFTPVSSGIRNICAVDTNVVWVSASDGTTANNPRKDYSMTSDGGATWTSGTIPAVGFKDWAMITALDDSLAWAILFKADLTPPSTGEIWHTTNAGTTWTRQDSTIFQVVGESFPNIIHFWTPDSGVVVGDPVGTTFEIYTTTNGGTSWDAVPSADIATPLTGEAGWTTNMSVIGDTIWFDTNTDRVYRSVDRGYTWTAYTVGLPVPAGDLFNISFYSSTGGIARYFDDVTQTNHVMETGDGGETWTSITPTGTFFTGDFARVPGSDSMLISTGIAFADHNVGTSFSYDGGRSWVTMDTLDDQRGKLGVVDSLHFWCGGFTEDAFTEGIFKYSEIPTVLCSEPGISAGTLTLNDAMVCNGDPLEWETTGFLAPKDGYWSGLGWIISLTDISNSAMPTLESSVNLTFFPVIDNTTGLDGRIWTVNGLASGTHYITPFVFGNASVSLQNGIIESVLNVQDLVLDSSCIVTGTSVMFDVCSGVGVNEINAAQLSVNSYSIDQNAIGLLINSPSAGKSTIQLFDMSGRIVKSFEVAVANGVNRQTINVSDIAAGTYAVKTVVNGNTAVNKIVKY